MLSRQALGSRALDLAAVPVEDRHGQADAGDHRIDAAHPLDAKTRSDLANAGLLLTGVRPRSRPSPAR